MTQQYLFSNREVYCSKCNQKTGQAEYHREIWDDETRKYWRLYKFDGRLYGFPDSRMNGVLASIMKFIR